MDLKCKFKQQNDVVERGTFKSRKVWVIDDENADYPQTIEVEVAQDKVNLFNNFRPGQPLTVSINLRGREWTNPQGEVKVFNTLQCWKVTPNVFNQQEESWKVTSDVADQQEEEEIFQPGDQFELPMKAAPKRKAGNIEKKFEEEHINSLGGDLPF
jgi:hypothetical protein